MTWGGMTRHSHAAASTGQSMPLNAIGRLSTGFDYFQTPDSLSCHVKATEKPVTIALRLAGQATSANEPMINTMALSRTRSRTTAYPVLVARFPRKNVDVSVRR